MYFTTVVHDTINSGVHITTTIRNNFKLDSITSSVYCYIKTVMSISYLIRLQYGTQCVHVWYIRISTKFAHCRDTDDFDWRVIFERRYLSVSFSNTHMHKYQCRCVVPSYGSFDSRDTQVLYLFISYGQMSIRCIDIYLVPVNYFTMVNSFGITYMNVMLLLLFWTEIWENAYRPIDRSR